jgi:PhoPQ-activated pathogenicity-related protein
MTLLACYSSVVKGAKTPQFSWTLEDNGSIRVKTQDKPDAVKLWQATNPAARDFRLMTIGPAWKSSELEDEGGTYIAHVEKPEKGWTAFFAELTYKKVVPEVKPFKFEQPTRPK